MLAKRNIKIETKKKKKKKVDVTVETIFVIFWKLNFMAFPIQVKKVIAKSSYVRVKDEFGVFHCFLLIGKCRVGPIKYFLI